jgi:hypothetical protein
LVAPSLSGAAGVEPGSADGGRECNDPDAGCGEWGRVGTVVGVTLDAMRQKSSKLSVNAENQLLKLTKTTDF